MNRKYKDDTWMEASAMIDRCVKIEKCTIIVGALMNTEDEEKKIKR